MMSSQSASARFISRAKAVTSPGGTCGSDAPWQTRIFAVTAPGLAGRVVARLPWMLTTAARSAPAGRPARARASAAMPPKQKPTAASRPAASGHPDSAVRPARAPADEQFRVVAQGQ